MDVGTRTAGSSGVSMGRHLRSGERVHLRAARSAQRLAIDNIREASRRRSAHIILASANTPAKIRKVERGCAVANTPDCSDSVKEIDRKSVVEGQRVSVRVKLGGRRYIKKKKRKTRQ